MAVVEMKKVGVFAHKSDFESLSSRLAELGVIQVTSGCENPTDTGKEIETRLAKAERVRDFLVEIKGKEPSKPELSLSELISIAKNAESENIVDKIEKEKAELDALKSQAQSLEQQIINLSPFEKFPDRLDSIVDTNEARTFLGFVPKDCDFENLCANIESSDLLFQKEFNRDANDKYVFVVYHKDAAQIIEKHFSDCNFARFHPGKMKDTPAKELQKLRKNYSDTLEAIGNGGVELKKHADEFLPTLAALIGYYSLSLSESRLRDMVERTEQTTYFTGWVRKRDLENLRKDLSKRFDAVAIAEVPPDECESPPIALQNLPFVEAFEVITDLYGRPRPGMLDPTPFIASFFPIYFGLCLTDAGYGSLLTAVAAILLSSKKSGAEMKKFMRMLLYAGICTIIIGALAGGWFGLDISSMNNPVAKVLLKIKIFDPLDDALLFFALSILLGTVHVSVGYICSAFIAHKEGSSRIMKIRSELLALSWIAITIGSGILISNFLIPNIIGPLMPFAVNCLKFGALGIVGFSIILGVAGGRSIGGSVADGLAFSGLYGIIGIFADLLSYARILALGLSSGVIAGVINIISRQINELLPGIGIVFAILIAVVAHVGYAALSTIGAFVHPARLNFVEFFTKFYEAGGEPFKPFSRDVAGVRLVEEKK